MSDATNPRAFPSAAIDDRFGGMELRDWFAGMAVGGLASIVTDDPYPIDQIARDAYSLADAMLAQRGKGPE